MSHKMWWRKTIKR